MSVEELKIEKLPEAKPEEQQEEMPTKIEEEPGEETDEEFAKAIEEEKAEIKKKEEEKLEQVREKLRKIFEPEDLEKILEKPAEIILASLRRLEGEKGEEKGEMAKIAEEKDISEELFWEGLFPKLKEQFWKAEEEWKEIPPPKDEIEQSELWNSKPNPPLKGRIMDGFKSTGKMGTHPRLLDKEGIIPSESKWRNSEVTVVDRKKDKNLSKLCKWSEGLKNEFPDEEERIFQITQRIYREMGDREFEKLFEELKKMEEGKEEVLIGDIKYGVCRHRALLFQVLAVEAGLNSTLKWSRVEDEGIESAHAYNEIRLRDGQLLVVDATNPPHGEEKYFDELSYEEFKDEGGFPRFGSNRLPLRSYWDARGRFQGGRLGTEGLQKLISKEE